MLAEIRDYAYWSAKSFVIFATVTISSRNRSSVRALMDSVCVPAAKTTVSCFGHVGTT
jgi:hypothetical protein